ncbi:hypothetical protein HNR32_001957 [Pectinatus brassicae]|uniref:Uncharacterized protein n=1 Tax=Pectinatus brassicae TaxID=862415 RepID=A0A840URM3_9FIRM|nr:hypothetical protein [Pectinatus brassicae]
MKEKLGLIKGLALFHFSTRNNSNDKYTEAYH